MKSSKRQIADITQLQLKPRTKERARRQTLRLHGVDPLDVEKQIPTSAVKDSFTDDSRVFKRVWEAFPKAPVEITVRNFNKLRYRVKRASITLCLWIPGFCDGRFYGYYQKSLNPKLHEFLMKQVGGRNKVITARRATEIANRIAKITGRTVLITHQQGGDPADAHFETYGPFHPHSHH